MYRIAAVAIAAVVLSGTSVAQVPDQNAGQNTGQNAGQADSSQASRLPQAKVTPVPTVRAAQGTPSASLVANVAKLRSLGYWFDYKTGRWMPPTKPALSTRTRR